MADSTFPEPKPERLWPRLLRILRPSHQHSAFSATLLLMTSVMLGRVIGYLRECMWPGVWCRPEDRRLCCRIHPPRFSVLHPGGRNGVDPVHLHLRTKDLGGTKARGSGRLQLDHHHHDRGNDSGYGPGRDLHPTVRALAVSAFTVEQMQLCVYLTRILLPGQIFFYAGGVVSAVLYSRQMFLFPALSPVIYGASIILGDWLARIASASRPSPMEHL